MFGDIQDSLLVLISYDTNVISPLVDKHAKNASDCEKKNNGGNGAFCKETEEKSEICTNHSTCVEDSERGKSLIWQCLKPSCLGATEGLNRKLIINTHGKPRVSLRTVLPTVKILYRMMEAQQLQQFSEDG